MAVIILGFDVSVIIKTPSSSSSWSPCVRAFASHLQQHSYIYTEPLAIVVVVIVVVVSFGIYR